MKAEAKERQKAAGKKRASAKRDTKGRMKPASSQKGTKLAELETTEPEETSESEGGKALVLAAKMTGAGKNSTEAMAAIGPEA